VAGDSSGGRDQFGGMTGSLPRSEPFLRVLDGGKCVDQITIAKGDALGRISNQVDQGNKKSREGCFSGVTEVDAVFGNRKESAEDDISGQ
jgi:hypothetical protein